MQYVVIDTETTGIDPATSQVIQVAALPVDTHWHPVGQSFEIKVQLQPDALTTPEAQEAVAMNSYDPDVWAKEAVGYVDARKRFARFLDGFKSVKLTSKKGNQYSVAQGVAFNWPFDFAHLRAWFDDDFLPLRYHGLDALQVALWKWRDPARVGAEKGLPESMKLVDLCKHLDIPHDAHDALGDCHATAAFLRWCFEVKGVRRAKR